MRLVSTGNVLARNRVYNRYMRTVVGVLRGGPSSEYDVSLKTGASVLEHIDRDKFDARDIFIDRDGAWHLHGLAVPPQKALMGVDIAFNALHGQFGEDGSVQRLLDSLAVPYSGSGAFASSLAFNKHLTKEAAKKIGVKIAHSMVVERQDPEVLAHQLFRTFPHPARVRALNGRGSLLADNFAALTHSLERVFAVAERALIEEHIAGRAASVGVIRNFRSEPLYALIPVPNDLLQMQKTNVAAAAKAVHDGLGLGHYSHLDFIVSRRGVYLVDTTAHPPLHTGSLFHTGLEAVGSSLKEFLTHVITLAKHQ